MNTVNVGARKYRHKKSVIDMVNPLPLDSVIITSSCKDVCTWVREEAVQRDIPVILYEPNLTNISACFEIPKKYYARNKEMEVKRENMGKITYQDDSPKEHLLLGVMLTETERGKNN